MSINLQNNTFSNNKTIAHTILSHSLFLDLKVFPIEIPEALTCLTVWKRFNDIKALLKFVKKRHKSDGLNGIVPSLNNHTYFKRFEADVITERKLFIIRLLDFVGQHPTLYKSQVFQEFFATSQTMPKDDSLQFEADDIPCTDTTDGSAKVTNPPVDSDETPVPSTSSSLDESFESSSMSTPIIDSPAENSDDGYKASSENDTNINDSIKIQPSSKGLSYLTRQYSRYFLSFARLRKRVYVFIIVRVYL